MSELAARHGMIVGSIVNHFLASELPGKSSFISDHQLYAETQGGGANTPYNLLLSSLHPLLSFNFSPDER